jgi:hypothetical protein
MFLANFMFQKYTYNINLALAMTKCEIVSTHLDPLLSLCTSIEAHINSNIIPCSNALELCLTSTIPNHMLF